MKYLLVLTALFAAFNGAVAQNATEEAPGPILTAVSQFLNDTGTWFQTVQIPTIGEGQVLTTLTCGQEKDDAVDCNLVGGVTGVNVCRKVAGFEVTLCAPKVFDQFVGSVNDQCGCCGGGCEQRQSCLCDCQEGKGVLVEHNLFKLFGRQITWNACYTPTIARTVMETRPEFGCSAECPAAREAALAAEASP